MVIPPAFKGMTQAETFHIIPDRGMGLFFFDTKKSATSLPEMQRWVREYSQMFDCKVTWNLGILNETLPQKLSNQSRQ